MWYNIGMANREAQPTPERKKGFLEAWKKFNTVTMFVWIAAGFVIDPIFFAAAGFDLAQNYLINRYQESRAAKKQKASQPAGRLALKAA